MTVAYAYLIQLAKTNGRKTWEGEQFHPAYTREANDIEREQGGATISGADAWLDAEREKDLMRENARRCRIIAEQLEAQAAQV